MSAEVPMVHMWEGRNIEELSREELLDVVRYLGSSLAFYHRPGMGRAIALGQVELWRRGEG